MTTDVCFSSIDSSFILHPVLSILVHGIGVRLVESKLETNSSSGKHEVTNVILTFTSDDILTDVQTVEFHLVFNIVGSTISDRLEICLMEITFPYGGDRNEISEKGEHCFATKGGKLSLNFTIHDIGDLGLNEISVVVVVGSIHNGTETNSAKQTRGDHL